MVIKFIIRKQDQKNSGSSKYNAKVEMPPK